MDEYGSFEGVVTAADVLEAIVGDPADAEAQPGGGDGERDGALVMDGMMPVDELKSRLALPDLPAEGSYHTLGGTGAGAAAAGAAGGGPHRVFRLAVRGAGDGRPAGRQGARQPRAGGRKARCPRHHPPVRRARRARHTLGR